MSKPLSDCCSQPGLMPFEQGLERLLAAVGCSQTIEIVALEQALGRVLAEDQISRIDVPPCDNSAMDGYAVRVAELAQGRSLPISQRIPAGIDPQPLEPGSVARIFTGASIPQGADAVVMQEDVQLSADQAVLPSQVSAGAHIRRRGQDIAQGDVVVKAGTRLQPQHLGVLASIGIGQLPCFKPLRIALLSTGDELVRPGEQARPGQIYNSNHFSLSGLLRQLGMEPVDLGMIEDTPEATRAALQQAAEQADCILSSGGVSVGEEDHVKAAVESLGQIDLWKLAIKPGKPLAFGRVGQAPFIGLPGNPVSAMLCFHLLARPVLLKMQGVLDIDTQGLPLPIQYQRQRPQQRREYLRVNLVQTAEGWQLKPLDNQSSGVLSSIVKADGYAVIPAGATLEPGELVEFISLSQLQ